jgi:hypothetical protein
MNQSRPLAQAEAGDFHFELRKKGNGKHEVLRSDISDPARTPEVVTPQELPSQVFDIFKDCMN